MAPFLPHFSLLANTKSSTRRIPSRTSRIKRGGAMSSHSTVAPSWLQDSQSHPHVNAVYRTLAQREGERINFARTAATGGQFPTSQSPEHVDHYYSENAGCENSWGNRYLDVKPYDRTRVIVGGKFLSSRVC